MNTEEQYPVERLAFCLPEFLRLAWASELARGVWSMRLQRVCRAWAVVEVESVASKLRDFAVVRMSDEQFTSARRDWESRGLRSLALEVEPGASASRTRQFVLGRSDLGVFLDAWLNQNHELTGKFLGYPACCRSAFNQRCAAGNLLDHTWGIAAKTVNFANTFLEVESTPAPLLNTLWRWLGVRAIPHMPCSFECAASSQLAREYINLANARELEPEMTWLEEVLNWPTEWSSLHGIAEVKTPILKFSTRTDAVAAKLVVRWNGNRYPEEGAQGVAFPYRKRARALVTESTNFRRGLNEIGGLVRIAPGDCKS